jgi:hypothetical protein
MYRVTAPAACPRCTKPFECGIDTGDCWCREVTLHPTTRAAFAAYYEGCLCRDCLTTMEDRPATPSVRQFLTAQLKRKWGRGGTAAEPPSR